MLADYDSEYNAYNLEGRDCVESECKVYHSSMNVNSDTPIIGHFYIFILIGNREYKSRGS